eukprot:1897690-Rhodomonas_salina.2
MPELGMDDRGRLYQEVRAEVDQHHVLVWLVAADTPGTRGGKLSSYIDFVVRRVGVDQKPREGRCQRHLDDGVGEEEHHRRGPEQQKLVEPTPRGRPQRVDFGGAHVLSFARVSEEAFDYVGHLAESRNTIRIVELHPLRCAQMSAQSRRLQMQRGDRFRAAPAAAAAAAAVFAVAE